ncbi:MAG TPA: hypothetical protein VGG20_18305 [Thermoanaerobaculia bacterium]
MKKKTPRKLHLHRETLRTLGSDRLSGIVGGATTTKYLQACSNPCHTDLCNGNDTNSCNVFSCASCFAVTCGCDTLVDQCP